MDSSGALAAAKDEAKQWSRGLNAGERAGEQFAVYAAGQTAASRSRTSPRDINRAHRRHRQGRAGQHRGREKKTALWSAIRQAGNGLADDTRAQAEPVRLRRPDRQRQRRHAAAAVGAVADALGRGVRRVYTGAGTKDAGLELARATTNGGQLRRPRPTAPAWASRFAP